MKEELNKIYFKNGLLVNLTRGTKGTFIYCEDEKLEKWINNKIIKK
ncbi:DNA/RNA helicase domain-containing protein [Candidatus Mycoplasma mahonii]